MNRPFPRDPARLESAAPVGEGADPHLGLRRFVVGEAPGAEGDQPHSPRVDDLSVDCAGDFRGYLQTSGLTVHGCCEADLRTYLYQLLPMREQFRRTIRARHVLRSLAHFFQVLKQELGVGCPWATAILKDESTFVERWKGWPGEEGNNHAKCKWLMALHRDLDDRVFVPALMDGWEEWDSAEIVPGLFRKEEDYGSLPDRLLAELSRRWLVWREEVIAAGARSPALVRAILTRRQREWETRPHPGLGGETPAREVRKSHNRW